MCDSLHAGGSVVVIGDAGALSGMVYHSASRPPDARPRSTRLSRHGALLRSAACFPLRSFVLMWSALTSPAGHSMIPSLGQGCNSALESAAALAAALRESPGGDVPAALAQFSQRRKPDTDAIQRLSTGMEAVMNGRGGASCLAHARSRSMTLIRVGRLTRSPLLRSGCLHCRREVEGEILL